MSEIPGDFLMIGLHKLAAERGDGLVPELLELYRDRAMTDDARRYEQGNTLDNPGSQPSNPTGNDNVIAFRPYLRARKRR